MENRNVPFTNITIGIKNMTLLFRHNLQRILSFLCFILFFAGCQSVPSTEDHICLECLKKAGDAGNLMVPIDEENGKRRFMTV